MNSNTGEILSDEQLKKLSAEMRAGFDIPLSDAQAQAFGKLTPTERVDAVKAIRASCGSACPSIKDRFKRRK